MKRNKTDPGVSAPGSAIVVGILLDSLQKAAIAQNCLNWLPQIKGWVVNVIAIAFKLRELISIPFISLHDCFGSGKCDKYFGESQLSKATLKIIFLFVLFHAFEMLVKYSVDMGKVFTYIGKLRVASDAER